MSLILIACERACAPATHQTVSLCGGELCHRIQGQVGHDAIAAEDEDGWQRVKGSKVPRNVQRSRIHRRIPASVVQ